MPDYFLEAFKDKIGGLWKASDSQFDFAVACYLQGRADAERIKDPGLNTACHILENRNDRTAA